MRSAAGTIEANKSFRASSANATSVSPRVVGGERLLALDSARLLAAGGVVWIHGCQTSATLEWAVLGRFAVPFFSAAAAYFLVVSLMRRGPGSLSGFVGGRFRRLYLPFLAWSGVYLGFKAAKAWAMPTEPNAFPGWELLWSGGAYHLWFIPYLMVASCAINLTMALWRRVAPASFTPTVPAAVLGIAGGALAVALANMAPRDSVLMYSMAATPALLWGWALGWLASHPRGILRPDTAVSLTAGVLFVVCQGMLYAAGRQPMLENAAGMALVVAALSVGSLPGVGWAAKLGQVSLGIYFAHLLVLKIAEVAIYRGNAEPGVAATMLAMMTAMAGASAVAWMLARFRGTRWLVA